MKPTKKKMQLTFSWASRIEVDASISKKEVTAATV